MTRTKTAKPKPRAMWEFVYPLNVKKFAEDVNFAHKFKLSHADNEVFHLQDKFETATKDRQEAWDKFAHELTGLKPGDVFKTEYTEWLYVGYAAMPCTERTPNGKSFAVGKNFIQMFVLPFIDGTQVVQRYMPNSLPLAPIKTHPVPELAEMWVRLRDPVLKFEERAAPYVELKIPNRVRIPIPVPVPQQKRSKR